MPKIVHIAVKVDGLDKVEEFYQKVFGFESVGRSRSEDRSRAAVTDGEINLTMNQLNVYSDDELEFKKKEVMERIKLMSQKESK